MTSDRARWVARLLAGSRVALGVTAIVVPTWPSRPWVGPEAHRPAVKLFARSLGARDLAVGLGGVLALRHAGPVRGWVEAGGLCDAGDVAGTLVHFKDLPRVGRLVILAVAGGSLALSRWLAPRVDAVATTPG
ncbi:MAG: hypothetical protein ACRD1K_07780 [Acidimicrobiales bacterium]